jgi:tetratricopeptide (TPR) repeat protein
MSSAVYDRGKMSARRLRKTVASSSVMLLACAALLVAQGDEADRLYAGRANLSSARRAVALWKETLAKDPQNFDAAWKVARGDYWLGGHVPEGERDAVLEDGMAHGRTAVMLRTSRPEGHFWLAANMGAAGERSRSAGLKYRKAIKEELETVLRQDPSFLQGSADRALGRWYAKVPRLFGGSKKNAEEHLRASLQYDPQSTASHYFLAELLLDDGRREEARAEAQRVLDAPADPQWEPENQEFKTQARTFLSRIK